MSWAAGRACADLVARSIRLRPLPPPPGEPQVNVVTLPRECALTFLPILRRSERCIGAP
jgi:hypothetical protein